MKTMKKSLCVLLIMVMLLGSVPSAFAASGGQWKDYGNQWAYQFADGSWAYNWQQIDGTWYYFGGDGWMKTGWQQIDSAWYYFYGSGAMAADTTIDGCYLDANGVWQEKQEPAGGTDKWVDYGNNRWAYQYADGSWAYGLKTIDGVRYSFGSDGWMKTGWQEISGKWYYFSGSGAMVTGWKEIDGTWYWFDAKGPMATGLKTIDGVRYCFNDDGSMVTGWKQIGSKYYYFDGNGAMVTGWRKIGSGLYYFYDNGVMAADTWIGDRYLGPSGACGKGSLNKAEQARVHNQMMALQSQYPEGMPWTNANCYVHQEPGFTYYGYGCVGFALILQDTAFGDAPLQEVHEILFEDLRVGDILRIYNDTHSVIITEVHPDYVVLAEGNYNYSIHWGRTMSRDEVLYATNFYWTRYQD